MTGASRQQIFRLLERASKDVPRRTMPKVKDMAVIDGTRKWIELIQRLEFCPFMEKYANASNSEILVQRSLNENDILLNALHVLDNPELNIATIVMPTLPMPDPEQVADISDYFPKSKSGVQRNQLIPSLVMGEPLIKATELLENHGLIAAPRPADKDDDDETTAKTVTPNQSTGTTPPPLFAPVVFNPFLIGSANWSPWPTIQFIKSSVMAQAKAEYREAHDGQSASLDIPRRNEKRLDELLGSATQQRSLLKQLADCYKGNDLDSYKEFMKFL